jgi:RHS repeat-associated protein
VSAGTIDLKRAAGVRGQVLGADGTPLGGVRITIADHAEYGYASSGEDGHFTVAVNGGGSVVVRLSKGGYLRAERFVDVPWQGYAHLDAVVLMSADSNPTLVRPAQGNLQIAQGAPVTDGDGSRQAVLAFPPGTTASMVLANGTRVGLGSLRVRVTEVTVGENGLAAMPAPLPATTAYTYAVAYTVDEAIASGDRQVEFNQPIFHYNENFIDFPVGQSVPSAYYDEAAHQWVTSTDGRVIKLLGTTNGQTTVDVDGKGTPASSAVLATMKFTTDELAMLAGRYAPGTTLWRVPITHFSTWDYNWPWAPPPGSSPPEAKISVAPSTTSSTNSCGSIIENENQVVGERFAIPGTPFSLNYRSNRTPGFKGSNEVFIKLLGDTVPPSLSEVLVTSCFGSKCSNASLAPMPNLGHRFLFDGETNDWGRRENGVVRPHILVGFRYPLVYTPPPANVDLHFDQVSFGALSGNPLLEVARGRMDVISWQEMRPANIRLGTYDARGVGMGGWTIDVHHVLDKLNSLWLGDGNRRAEEIDASQTILSDPPWGKFMPQDKMAVANDGKIYIGASPSVYSSAPNAIYRIDPATKQTSLFFGLRSLPAPLGCDFMALTALDAGPDGNIYFGAYPACNGWNCGNCQYQQLAPYIFKLSPTGSLLGQWKVGDFTGWTAYTGIPTALRVARNGTIYYLEARQWQGSVGYELATCLRVMKLESNGRKSMIAGGDCASPNVLQYEAGHRLDAVPAASAVFAPITTNLIVGGIGNFATDLAIGRDGSLYVSNYTEKAVFRISPDGWKTVLAGRSNEIVPGEDHRGDGQKATDAAIVPTALAVDGDDTVYIADFAYHGARDWTEIPYYGFPRGRVRAVKGGIIRSVLGATDPEHSWHGPDGTPAMQSPIYGSAYGLALGPDGALYVFDSGDNHLLSHWNTAGEAGNLRRFARPLPWVGDANATVVSQDGTEVYAFDSNGRHLSTNNALTGKMKYKFTYDRQGQLSTITDASNLVTRVERMPSGLATAIVAPNGQRTALTVNADDYLEAIDEPGGIHRGFTYGDRQALGLLTSYQNPRGNTSNFTYDELGRVTGESMPGGCSWTIERLNGPSATSPDTPVKVALTSAEGRTRSYQLGSDADNLENRPRISSAGLTTQYTSSRAGVETTSTPDGMVTTVTKGPDGQFGLQRPIEASRVVRTPGGKQMSISSTSSAVLDGAKMLVSRVDATAVNAKTSTSTYNAALKTITSVSPMGRQTVTTLDEQGRTVKVQAGNLAPTSYAYDPRGRLSSVAVGTVGSARVTGFGYDDLDRLDSVTDPMNRVQQYGYDAANRVVTQTFADGSQVGFGYDANGNLTSVTPPGRPEHGFGFTPNDLMSSYTPPVVAGVGATTYEYNHDKQPSVIHRPDGSTINFTYDSAGRLWTTTYPSIGGNVTVTRTYSPTTGQLTGVTTSDGQSLAYGYDGKLVTSTTWSGNVAGSVGRTYNNDFRVASETVNGANSVAFGYDNDGLLTSIDGLTITRDSTNGLITETTLGQVTDHRTYDTFGKLATYEAKFGSTSLYSVSYVPDSLGRIEQKTETIQGTTTVWNYSYDSAGRLWQVMQNGILTATYLYDANGNRTSVTTPSGTQTATYDVQDRLLTYGNLAYTYTPNGDLQSKTDTTTGQVTSYAYDGQGNLRHVDLPDGRAIDYLIDSENRRVAKKVNGAVVRKWIYQDQLKPVAEFEGTGTLLARYLDGLTIKSGTSYRVVADHLGTPRLLVSSTTGAVAQRLDVDEWGQVTTDSAVGYQAFGFGGGIYDSDTGLVRFGSRDYDPGTGRWAAKDRIIFAGRDSDLYGYVMNDPVNIADPTGEVPFGNFAKRKLGQLLAAFGRWVAGELPLEPVEPLKRRPTPPGDFRPPPEKCPLQPPDRLKSVTSPLLDLLDFNGDGIIDYQDVFEAANPFGPLGIPLQQPREII